MEKSQFSQYIAKFLKGVVLLLTTTINGKEAEQLYLYKTMLTKKFSPLMKWETLNVDGRAVMADVVALDARFPLKKRASMSRASGDIPKLGTKRSLNETQMNEIMLLRAMPDVNETAIANIIFADTIAVTKGIWERIEYMFLQGLSNDGVYGTSETDNVGVEIRVDLGMPDKNKYGVTLDWSDPAAKPVDDILNVVRAAKRYGHNLGFIHMNYATFTNLLSNTQIKRYVAVDRGYGVVPDSGLANASSEQLKNVFRVEFGLTIQVIDRSFIIEIDGVDTVAQGWVDNKVVLTPTMNVGQLVYTTLAAEMNKNKAVDYAKVDDYTLISIYQKLDDTPLELTTSQARVLPVINMYNVYSIDTTDVTVATQTEGNSTITLYGVTTVVKTDAITALKALGVSISANATDATVEKKVNELNDADEAAFKTAMGL